MVKLAHGSEMADSWAWTGWEGNSLECALIRILLGAGIPLPTCMPPAYDDIYSHLGLLRRQNIEAILYARAAARSAHTYSSGP